MSAEPNPIVPLRRWATTKQAAAHICVNPEVLRRWNRDRENHPWLPRPRRVGKDFRWDLNALDAALAAREDD
ncbi:hypothetical protein [Nocardia higoensis]|uniref:hypothetical protein n=1 Tax=Nocardia higoensis TaxID=228599 RepID=UPI0002E2F1C0|nr:hypothetical protein [Nocardia higoensis]